MAVSPTGLKAELIKELIANCIMFFRSDDKIKQQQKIYRRLIWTAKGIPDSSSQEQVSVPFTVDRVLIRICQYGKPHKRTASKVEGERMRMRERVCVCVCVCARVCVCLHVFCVCVTCMLLWLMG